MTPKEISFPARCEHCDTPYYLADWLVLNYLLGAPQPCGKCGQPSSVFKAVMRTMQSPMKQMFGSLAADLIGARTLILNVNIRKNEVTSVDLSSHGIQSDCTILKMNYTSAGRLIPLEWHGNERSWAPSNVLNLYGAVLPMLSGSEGEASCGVNVLITYIAASASEPAIYSLSKAYQHYLAAKWGQMAIAAITGIEFSLKQAMAKFVPRWATVKDKAYLKEVYPDYCKRNGILPLDSELLELVSRLWGTRDHYAHTGLLIANYDEASATKQLCAAIFLYRHIRQFCSPPST